LGVAVVNAEREQLDALMAASGEKSGPILAVEPDRRRFQLAPPDSEIQ